MMKLGRSLPVIFLWISTSTAAQAFNPKHLERLQKTNQCPMCDLSGANLEDANLFGANLVNANLTGANLAGANLGAANLTDANLTGAKLIRTYFHQATLENTNLSQADLTGAYLKGVTLNADISLIGANLRGVNLSRTNLVGVNLQGADLREANLSHVTFSGIRSQGDLARSGGIASLFAFGLSSRVLCDIPISSLLMENSKQTAEEARRMGLDLSFAKLSNADLSGADLTGAMLVGGDLRGANLSGAKLDGACLKGTKLQNAKLDGANLSEARLEGALLDGASLTGVRNANLQESFSTQAEAASAPAQQKAKSITGAINRAQQAYFLEKEKFANNLLDLGLGIKPESDAYQYRIFYHDRKQAVMVAAIPKSNGLKTYIGLVNLGKVASTNEETTFTTLCESEQAKPLLPKLPTKLPQQGPISCPSGFTKVDSVEVRERVEFREMP